MYGIVTQTVETYFHILTVHFYSKAVLSLDTVITVIMQLIQNILWCKKRL